MCVCVCVCVCVCICVCVWVGVWVGGWVCAFFVFGCFSFCVGPNEYFFWRYHNENNSFLLIVYCLVHMQSVNVDVLASISIKLFQHFFWYCKTKLTLPCLPLCFPFFVKIASLLLCPRMCLLFPLFTLYYFQLSK